MAVSALSIAGCSSTGPFEDKKIDYRSAGKLPPLEVPPDLSAPTKDDRFAIPDVPRSGATTYSEHQGQVTGKPAVSASAASLLPKIEKAKVERAGSQRWLVVVGEPEQVWPAVKRFWQDMGFMIGMEVPQSGVMETEWAENRAKIPQDGIRKLLGRALDAVYSTSERDKFRTRLERGATPGTTEIYISHRGMYEVIQGGDRGEQTIWQPRPADAELEADMLGRLLTRFGVDEAKSQAMVAAEVVAERARLVRKEGVAQLTLIDPFDRAWRRLGLALDRTGFTVEDRDRSRGVYFVRYVDPDAARKADAGIMDKLAFWKKGDGEGLADRYRIQARSTDAGTEVTVQNKDGQPEASDTAGRILGLLHEQLK